MFVIGGDNFLFLEFVRTNMEIGFSLIFEKNSTSFLNIANKVTTCLGSISNRVSKHLIPIFKDFFKILFANNLLILKTQFKLFLKKFLQLFREDWKFVGIRSLINMESPNLRIVFNVQY